MLRERVRRAVADTEAVSIDDLDRVVDGVMRAFASVGVAWVLESMACMARRWPDDSVLRTRCVSMAEMWDRVAEELRGVG